MEGKSLVFDISCDKPLIEHLDPGTFDARAKKKVLTTYYTGIVNYLPVENMFVSSILDWNKSTASLPSLTLTDATYNELTDHTRNCLREQAIYTAAWHVEETFPNIPNPPSPYRAEVGKRLFLDAWDYAFSDMDKSIQNLSDYGLQDCVELIHVWQRSGYDNALPAHYPAAESQGGDEGLRHLLATGTKAGYLVGVHENYMDYYPNYEHYNIDDIALDSAGNRTLAWNNGTFQSYGVRPSARVRLASTQSPEIHRRYGTTVCYLDVHAATPIWMYTDFRSGEKDAACSEAASMPIAISLSMKERRIMARCLTKALFTGSTADC